MEIEDASLISEKMELNRLTDLKLDVQNQSWEFLILSRLPQLETLHLRLPREQPYMYDNLKSLFDLSPLPRLKKLEIGSWAPLNDSRIYLQIFPSPLSNQLEILSLNLERISEEGANYIQNNQAALQNLKEFNLSYQSDYHKTISILKETLGDRLKLQHIKRSD